MTLDWEPLPESIPALLASWGWYQAGVYLTVPDGWLVNTSRAEPHDRSALTAGVQWVCY